MDNQDFIKLTNGYVMQRFNPMGECVSQHFVCTDGTSIENEDGDYISEPNDVMLKAYAPFDMVQP